MKRAPASARSFETAAFVLFYLPIIAGAQALPASEQVVALPAASSQAESREASGARSDPAPVVTTPGGSGNVRIAQLLAADTPASRDELFGLEPTEKKKVSGAAVSGFYDLGVAYTSSSPGHWSRAVNRLQLSAEGALSESVKYKVGARVDLDPVYAASDFYLPAVKKDQRADVIWRENYIDFSAMDWDFRVGAQQIVWGEVVGLFFADVVSARDQREFLLPSFDIIRIPQWAARAEYYAGDTHLEFIWIPVPTFDNIGKPGAEFYPVVLPDPVSADAAAMIRDPAKPARKLSNSNYGVRVNRLLAGWDVAAFYYRSFSTAPTFYPLTSDQGAFVGLEPRYDRIWQVGTTLTKDLDSFVLRAEAVYAHGQNFSTDTGTGVPGVVSRPTLDYIVSVEVPFENDARLNLQAFQRAYFGSSDSLALDAGDFGASVLFSWKLTRTLEPQMQWIQTFGGGGGLIRPRLTWRPDRNVSLATGVDIFTGPSNGLFGRFDHRDRFYTELRYDF